MSNLRGYQLEFKNNIYAAWRNGYKNVLGVLPTGAGKTVVLGEIAKEYEGCGIFIAHRQELLSQISCQLASIKVPHNIITPKNSDIRRQITRLHFEKFGKSYIDNRGKWLIGGVDTVISMEDSPMWRGIDLMITDEAHHLLKTNKWGKVFGYAKNAKLLGVTATPQRADGKALDTFDTMVEGVSMKYLIDNGYLCGYKILCPKTSDLDLDDVAISPTTGDYNVNELRKAVHKSKKIVGDVVKEYLKYAKGKLGVTFAVDVEEATKIASAFKEAGVPAEVISAKTPSDIRAKLLAKFRKREILQLVNVDLFGEGFDLPAIEVVSIVRKSASLALVLQQMGRVLRLFLSGEYLENWDYYTPEARKEIIAKSDKPFGLIIDHVGNVLRHNLPDTHRKWSLAGVSKKEKSENSSILLKTCLNENCLRVYLRSEITCPYCDTPTYVGKKISNLEMVDGDLELLTDDVLKKMRGEVEKVDGNCHPPHHLATYIRDSIVKKHLERQVIQKNLRETIALWAGYYGESPDRVNNKRFYLTFGMSVLEAMALGKTGAEELQEKIKRSLGEFYVTQ